MANGSAFRSAWFWRHARWTNSESVDTPVEHRVALIERLVELAEGGDLGRADEGEVLRPEEHDLPLAGLALVGNLLEASLGIGAHHRFEVEGRKLVANGQHETLR